MTDLEFKNIGILDVKGVDYRCILWGISKKEAVNVLDNSGLEDKGVLKMDFGADKMPVQAIKEGAFGGAYFGDVYSGVDGKCNRKSWKEFDQLKDIDQK